MNTTENPPYKILLEKEYYKMREDRPTIAMTMMVKNEKKRIHVSLESIVGHVDCLIIYDTGSTDDTIEIITEFCEKHKINLYLIQGEFVDFSTSRNVLLDYADTIDVKFLLYMDCNDELRGGGKLRVLAANQMDTPNTCYLLCQQWWCGDVVELSCEKYYNVRFVKNKTGWRYKGVVHEWPYNKVTGKSDDGYALRVDGDIFLYQDRTQDDDKTGKRFKRDYILLIAEHKRFPTEPRTLFYLAQTCACLGRNDEAFYYYKLRTELEGFTEEKFHAFMRCGNLSVKLHHSWEDTMSWYMKAYEYSERTELRTYTDDKGNVTKTSQIQYRARAEPVFKIAKHYRGKGKWTLAYNFARMACECQDSVNRILWIDKEIYEYERWHLMGIVAYYAGKFKDGKEACLKAIKVGKRVELDKENLKFYLEKEEQLKKERKEEEQGGINKEINKEIKNISLKPDVTKKEFMAEKMREIKQQYPKMNDKQIRMKALLLWKRRRKVIKT